MTALALPVRDRLLAVLDLAQRPGTDGERQAAEAAIGRIVLANATVFRALLTAAPPPPPPPPRPAREWDADVLDRFPSWHAAVEFCLRCADDLTSWERKFLVSISGFRNPSDKQFDVLRNIIERTLEAA